MLTFTVGQLRKKRRLTEPEDPVAQGYWGKPPCLEDAKNDFLCLEATLMSTTSPSNRVNLGIGSVSLLINLLYFTLLYFRNQNVDYHYYTEKSLFQY